MMGEKRVVFTENEQKFANFKIRLRYDNLSQGDFFRFMLSAYVDNDPTMLVLVEKCKTINTSLGKHKIRSASKMHKEGRTLVSELGLSDSERERIFDIIEHEEGK